jgi:polar amino acid transport system substrate-binding protein
MIGFSLRSFLSAVCCTVALLFTSCTKKEHPLKVLTTGTNAPFSFVDQNGNDQGFDIELVKLLAKQMGRDVTFVHVSFSELLAKLAAGEGDLAVGGISITDERKKMVLFSTSIHKSGFAMVMLNAASFEDAKSLSNKSVAVGEGTLQESLIKKAWLDVPNVYVTSLKDPKMEDIMRKIHSGEFFAFVTDSDSARYLSQKNSGVKVIYLDLQDATPSQGDDGTFEMGIAMQKTSAFKNDVNIAITECAPAIDQLNKKWFAAGASN